MNVYISTLTLEGTKLDGENPLPMFRNRNPHREVADNGSFTPEQKMHMGEEAGERYLPYRIQDRYTRQRGNTILKTITLENDLLKAVFLPEYGGRLYSLKDKRTDREILYKNPVFQPANLAILNAWFSGGIEWNIGQVGHTFTTCSPVHTAKLSDDEGNEFLRIYEYERCKNLFWHIDFHLPKGAEQLQIYVRMINDYDNPVPMYWWTNIAVEETVKARVFSSTNEAIYIDAGLKGYGIDKLPHLPSLKEADASYPVNFPFSSEYFFQTPVTCRSPWEAVAYEDGRLFFERSTSLLRYRKMFCWGNHAGGRRWCDFLAKPGEGNYIEVQGGLTPTQLHGIEMPGNSVWDFTQMIGVSKVDTNSAYQDSWDNAREYIERIIDQDLGENEVYAIHDRLQSLADKSPEKILHTGSGWGALERLRREKADGRLIPRGFEFTDGSIAEAQHPWLVLLQEGHLPDQAVEEIPASWMIQDEWMELVRRSIGDKDNRTWVAFLHYGVMLYEKGLEQEAVEAWEASLNIKPAAWVYRNLAEVMRIRGEKDKALSYLEQAYLVSNSFPDRSFAEEYLNLLLQNNEFEKAWRIYESLPPEFAKGDRIQIIVGAAALELDKEEFMNKLFNTEFAVIREGEVLIIELWYKYNAKKLAKERNSELTQELIEEAKVKFPPPAHIDFRTIGS
ncbi:DUF5107 domain-containing protein [Cohnella silvisoli]|uniref:DUF5107 domain-containing protein n=1 Tax=Cohnella silvisoli TaxID=2873699 RepID=A0ABV1L037_9BACL|nr:DUF5107 domain-containing protein [Cohnella silvisoli]MCD9024993.1 DUF5107 domain-containing protein [Cohnella silvisoli]